MGTRGSHKAHSTGLLSLPDDLLLDVAEFVPSQGDLTRMLRVNRRLHVVFSDLLLLQNIRYDNSSTLMWAVSHNRVEVVCRMVRLRAGLWGTRLADELGGWELETPLKQAVRDGNLRLVKILTGDEVQKTTETLKSVDWRKDLRRSYQESLRLALETKNESIAHILINRLNGVNEVISVDPSTQGRQTALHVACDKRLVGTTHYLLSVGADPNWKEKGSRLSFRYVEGLLVIKDSFRRRLDDHTLKILQLLFTYGLRPDGDLRKMGSEHGDPRVRWLFTRETVCVSQDQSAARESTALQLDDDTSFPPLVGAHFRKRLAHDLNDGRAAMKAAEYWTSLLSQPYVTEEQFDRLKMDTSTPNVNSFPHLGRDCPEVDNVARQRWTAFRKMEQHQLRTLEASQPRKLKIAAVKQAEPKEKNLTSLSSNVPHPRKAPSGDWTNLPQRDTSPTHNNSELPVASAPTSGSSAAIKGGHRKVRWRKLPL